MALTPLGTIIGEWICWLAALIFVCLRLWVRWYLQNRFSLSDGFVVLAMILMTYSHTVATMMHVWLFWKPLVHAQSPAATNSTTTTGPVIVNLGDLAAQKEQFRRTVMVFKMAFASGMAYYSAVWSIKASFVLFYYQLFPKDMKRLRVCLHVTAGLVFVTWLLMILMFLLWCRPVSRNWDLTNQCLSYNEPVPFYTAAGAHLLTDSLIYILPFFIFPALSLSPRKKLSLSLVFGLGLLCILSAIGRILATALSGKFEYAVLLPAIEQATAIIVACCPPLKWLYNSYKYSSYGGSSTAAINGDQEKSSPSQERPKRPTRRMVYGQGYEFGTLLFKSRRGDGTVETSAAGTVVDNEKQNSAARVAESGEKIMESKRRTADGMNVDVERLGGIEERREEMTLDDVRELPERSEPGPTEPHDLKSHPSNEQLPTALTSPYRRRS